jgi:signal transduction histidine kinase
MHEGDDRGVSLEVRGADKPLNVLGDRTRLAAALQALLHAALRERGEPGVIIANVSRARSGAPAAVVAIGDESIVGTLEETASKDAPFDEWRGGLGLALPVARRVVEAHGGALWSAPGDRPRAGSALRIPLKAS